MVRVAPDIVPDAGYWPVESRTSKPVNAASGFRSESNVSEICALTSTPGSFCAGAEETRCTAPVGRGPEPVLNCMEDGGIAFPATSAIPFSSSV